VNRELAGTTIMTRYNKTLYRVDEIDFTKSPKSTFKQRKQGGGEKEISFAQYYQERYNARV
jgi:aubergine-like protein